MLLYAQTLRVGCIASVWFSMPSRNDGDVAIVWRLEQSISFHVEPHFKRLNNAKQTSLTRPLSSTSQMISLACFLHRLQSPVCTADEHYRGMHWKAFIYSEKQLSEISLWTTKHACRVNLKSTSALLVTVSQNSQTQKWFPESVNNFLETIFQLVSTHPMLR